MKASPIQQAMETRPLPIEAIVLAQQLVLLPLYFFVPVWISFLNSIAAIAIVYQHYHPTFKISRWLKLGVTLLAIGSVLVVFRKFSGRDAGIALISAMYGLKILETNTRRDANLLMSLGFFMIVAGFLFSQKPWIALYQFVPVMAILNAFLAMQSLQTFHLGSGSFGNIIKQLGRYLLIAIPIMIVLFVFFPRLSGPLWHMPGSKTAVTGVSDVMGLTEIGELQLSDEIAFRVSFSGQVPAETDMYWRVLVLDQFDGLSWSRQGRSPIPDPDRQSSVNDSVDYTVTLEPTQQNYLVSLDRPLKTPKNGVLIDDYVIYSKFKIQDRTRYSIQSDPALVIDESARFSVNSIYLSLPENSNNKSRQWAVDLRQTVASDEAFVQAILSEINQQEFFYTLSPGIMDEPVIDSFWLDKRRGFCEHYASSLVFLARAAGIPARVVVGYQGGEKNPLSDYWLVRQARAHAWTEIWLQGRGWVRVDPTAAIARQRIEPNLLEDYRQRQSLFDNFDVVDLDDLGVFKQLQYWMDQMDNRWNDWILDYNSERQQQLFNFWGFERVTRQQLYFGMVTLVGFFVVLSSLRWFHQRDRSDPLARAFKHMLKKLEKQRVPILMQDKEVNQVELFAIGPMSLYQRLQQIDAVRYQRHMALIQQYIVLRYANGKANAASNITASKQLAKAMRGL